MDNMFRIKTLVTLLFPTLLYVSHTLQISLTFKMLQPHITQNSDRHKCESHNKTNHWHILDWMTGRLV